MEIRANHHSGYFGGSWDMAGQLIAWNLKLETLKIALFFGIIIAYIN